MKSTYIFLALISFIGSAGADPSGYVHLQDVDGSTTKLPGALVSISDTVNATTDADGYYTFTGVGAGDYTATASYNSAVSTQTKTISEASNPNNFTILFSKPAMSKPSLSGNYLTGTFSTNFKALNFWEIPNFMWGEYYYKEYINTSDDRNFYEQCVYQGNNAFACNAPNTSSDYTFRFVFSDMYNMNLSQYHPTLTGDRNFTSDYIYISNSSISQRVSDLPQAQREQSVSGWFWEGVFWIIMLFIGLAVLSFGSKE